MAFTEDQGRIIELSMRLGSGLSFVATLFVVLTFMCLPGFNKPINRLIFLASVGNLLAVMAGLIGRAGIKAGDSSPLCQFQAFLVTS